MLPCSCRHVLPTKSKTSLPTFSTRKALLLVLPGAAPHFYLSLFLLLVLFYVFLSNPPTVLLGKNVVRISTTRQWA